jgi:hypothetical protein
MLQALSVAYASAYDLAQTLMVCVVVFKASLGQYGAMVASEYDSDPGAIIHEFDPSQLSVAGGAGRCNGPRHAGRLAPAGAAPGQGEKSRCARIRRMVVRFASAVARSGAVSGRSRKLSAICTASAHSSTRVIRISSVIVQIRISSSIVSTAPIAAF